MNLAWFLLIGLAAGWLAGKIMKGGGFGLVGDLILGVIGALLGGSCSACSTSARAVGSGSSSRRPWGRSSCSCCSG
jgi:uncharacterized membrane protein YeaQ/YmgE (transglycosylase-associated protein family)